MRSDRRFFLLLVTGVVLLGSLAMACQQCEPFYVYTHIRAETGDKTWAVGSWVEDYGSPDWGDELQYVYFLSGDTGYTMQITLANHGGPDDPTPDHINPHQHPDNPARSSLEASRS